MTPLETTIARAYANGRSARLAGKPNHNVWQRRGPAERAVHSAWERGWLDADREQQEEAA